MRAQPRTQWLLLLFLLLLLLLLPHGTQSSPGPPINVTTDLDGVDKQLKVSWVAPSASHASATAVVSYTIACRGSASCPATLANVDKSLTTHTFTGLTNGDQYSFQVMALDKDGLNGTSAWSPPGVPSCGSGVLEFSAASYDVVEGKVVVLTVLRRAGAAGFVQVSVNSLVPGVEYAPGKKARPRPRSILTTAPSPTAASYFPPAPQSRRCSLRPSTTTCLRWMRQ